MVLTIQGLLMLGSGALVLGALAVMLRSCVWSVEDPWKDLRSTWQVTVLEPDLQLTRARVVFARRSLRRQASPQLYFKMAKPLEYLAYAERLIKRSS